MKRTKKDKLLYRKVNSKSTWNKHKVGPDYKHSRNSKNQDARMTKKQRGLDYTPLFRFLISKVGSKFDDVFSEAKSRLDKTDPIFYLVARNDLEQKEVVRVSDDTYFSGLYVDNNGLLQFVNENIVGVEKDIFSNSVEFGFDYTFNGKLYHSGD